MRTRQFQRFVHQKMNQRFPENVVPFYGISLKKNSKIVPSKRKTNPLASKLEQVYAPLIKQITEVQSLGKKVQPLFSLDQLQFEMKKGQSQKTSDFGYQLHERKKLRWFYGGLSTRILRRLLVQAKKAKISATSFVLQNLEKRLDVVLYRCGFFESIYTARQWILQKRVYVNQRVVERGSFELQPGDVITIEKKWHPTIMRNIFERFFLFFKKSQSKFDEKYVNDFIFSIPSSQLKQKQAVGQILKTKRNPILFRPFDAMKPMHLEISYDTFTCIYMYAPQKISFPSLMDISAIQKSYSL